MIESVKQRVREFLTTKPKTRDNDMLLLAHIWAVDYKRHLGRSLNDDEKNLLKHIANNNFTSSESIRRCRQKLQELAPELRGARYQERKGDLELSVKTAMLNFRG